MRHDDSPTDGPGNLAIDASRFVAVAFELARDLGRASHAAVRAALADCAADLGPERASAIEDRIVSETAARYRAYASATLYAVRPSTD
ncbi:MAG: hypothetical protein ACREM6_03170 [Vulcanimicrobiaceae bacterium]